MKFYKLYILFFACLISCTRKEAIKNSRENFSLIQRQSGGLADSAYLRKISFHLRGENPSTQEYQELEVATKEGKQDAYLQKKISEYQASSQYIDKMNSRLNDLFLLKSQAYQKHWPRKEFSVPERQELEAAYGDTYSKNSLNYLFQDILTNNLSWDTLLTANKYRVFNYLKFKDTGGLAEPNDSALFRRIYSGKLPPMYLYSPINKEEVDKESEYLDIEFDSQHPQIAGAITTGRFFNRYATTNLNKNRRRAASIYRIFFCDDMVPAAGGTSGSTEEALNLAFPKDHIGAGFVQEGRHGTDAACMKCHSKLDPVGRAFSTSPFILSKNAASGVLNISAEDGKKLSVNFFGLRGLGKAITEQKEYLSCQVEHFWKWYIGEDADLTSQRQAELVQAFEKGGRRPNDFVQYLIQSQEFRKPLSDADRDWGPLAKIVLRRCDSCHSTHPEEELPVFAEFPIGGSQETMLRYTKKIRKALSLDGSGKAPDMPPQDANWQLTQEQKEIMQKWIAQVLKEKGGQ